MTKILISGGSGMIGSNLTKNLQKQGHQVSWLSRNPKNGQVNQYFWNPKTGEIDPSSLLETEAIIHLAGAGVADKRWTNAYKKEILNSRVEGTELLYNALKKYPNKVKTFISASAVGIYGTHPELECDENAPIANNFLAQVCAQWEEKLEPITELGIRTPIVRIGIVLSRQGGFVKEIAQLAKFGLAAPLGNGKMITPWIHVEDLSGIFIHLLQNPSLTGIYNGVAPNPATNKELTKAICVALRRPLFLPPIPGFVLRILVGPIAPMLLSSQNVSCQKILKAGYQFKFTNHNHAIQSLLLN
ncbi:MAG: TIGR01777 family oxidoreductase [Bacteroidia bacterium]|nr:TIGR01777 family oxidoreductase [Bacteroidia bacterium]